MGYSFEIESFAGLDLVCVSRHETARGRHPVVVLVRAFACSAVSGRFAPSTGPPRACTRARSTYTVPLVELSGVQVQILAAVCARGTAFVPWHRLVDRGKSIRC